MKVTPLPFQPAVSSPAVETTREAAAPASAAPAVVAPEASSDSAMLRAAQASLGKMEGADGIDAARVAEIRAALERGEINFDPAKLARLIERHHGGRG